jgi:Holliday junction resolvasome RuvABC DNA-binding subunit
MLGFNKNAADKAIDTVMRTAEGTISVELIIKAALKSL